MPTADIHTMRNEHFEFASGLVDGRSAVFHICVDRDAHIQLDGLYMDCRGIAIGSDDVHDRECLRSSTMGEL